MLAIPFVDGWVLDRVVAWDPGPRLNPVIATILLFGLPSLVLGSVSPVAVRLKASSIENLGRTAGRLFAVSTAGSIAGTFLTSFWLIPELGTDQVLASAAVALILAAAAVALVERLAVAFALALVLAGASVGAVVSLAPDKGGTVAASQLRNWSPVYRQRSPRTAVGGIEESQSGYKIVDTKDSQYHRIAVVDDDTSRYLRFDSSFQSGMYLDDPYRTRFAYSDYLQLSVRLPSADAPDPLRRPRRRLGAQADLARLPGRANRCGRARPGGRRHAPTSTSSCRAIPRLNVEVEDGRRYVAGHEGPWDVIVVDAFYSDSIPFHLATREFLELARSRLAPGGLVVTNIIGAVKGPDSRLFRSMLRTYRAVFPTVADPSRARRRRKRSRDRSATSSSWPARAPRRRSSSCSTAGARYAAGSPGAPDLARRSRVASMHRSRRRTCRC